MGWSAQTKQALHEWLIADTWHKNHPAEDCRFFLFVGSVWNDEHGIWDEAQSREIITNTAKSLHPGFDDLAADVAEKRVRQGTDILDFLSNLSEEHKFGLLTESRNTH